MLSSTTPLQEAAQIVAGEYLGGGSLLPKSDHIWNFNVFSKKKVSIY